MKHNYIVTFTIFDKNNNPEIHQTTMDAESEDKAKLKADFCIFASLFDRAPIPYYTIDSVVLAD